MMDNKNALLLWSENEYNELADGIEDDPDLEYFQRALKVYSSALEVFEGNGWHEIEILKRLLDGDPLCHLQNHERYWIPFDENSNISYHKRRPSLVRNTVKLKGEPVSYLYSDDGRVECIDQNDPFHPYNGIIENVVVNRIDPIAFPYKPVGKFKVYTERFLFDETNKDKEYDTLMITYVKRPDCRLVRVYQYYKYEKGNWTVIDEKEYVERKSKCKTS